MLAREVLQTFESVPCLVHKKNRDEMDKEEMVRNLEKFGKNARILETSNVAEKRLPSRKMIDLVESLMI